MVSEEYQYCPRVAKKKREERLRMLEGGCRRAQDERVKAQSSFMLFRKGDLKTSSPVTRTRRERVLCTSKKENRAIFAGGIFKLAKEKESTLDQNALRGEILAIRRAPTSEEGWDSRGRKRVSSKIRNRRRENKGGATEGTETDKHNEGQRPQVRGDRATFAECLLKRSISIKNLQPRKKKNVRERRAHS